MRVHIRVPVLLAPSPAIPHIPEHQGYVVVPVEAETTAEACSLLADALAKLVTLTRGSVT